MGDASRESRAQRGVRRWIGVTFLGAGILKLAVLPIAKALRPDLGIPTFGEIVATLEIPSLGAVPAPSLVAWLVVCTEIAGGIALLLRRRVALVCAVFVADMLAALATLSIPASLGHGPVIGEHHLGAEPWRIPLEVALLGSAIWLGRLSLRTPSAFRDESPTPSSNVT